MIGLAQNRSLYLDRCSHIWRQATCARNPHSTDKPPQYSHDPTTIMPPMLLPKPNHTDPSTEMSRPHQPTLGPKTCAKTPPLAKSP
jgi:hypothetical protein